ncbi:hypothetical protein [Geobacillus sp. JS12]|uniref:hypothetical protein n=1 Tax=Geobacillus sp. JS12 TaxID=1813182 RepID=UPI00078CD732|nr:hypothetical protein [Geobacillus sp. JS12]AMQ19673.1 hypothetical protein A0V43_00270 [Geobacillus sp. JS12]
MDIKKWVAHNKWFILVIIYLIALCIQIYKNGWGVLFTSSGIGLSIALCATIYNNSRSVKKFFRKIKYFLGFGMFKWEANAVFTVRKDRLPSLTSQESELEKIARKALENNGLDSKQPDAVQPSFDKLKNLKLFLKKYVMYLNVTLTDADFVDDDGNDLVYVNIKTDASLRFKDNNKAINGILLDFYFFFEQHYKPIEQKYSFKIEPEDMPRNFLIKQFINEFTQDEVDGFSIKVKNPRANEEVNEKYLSLTTNRREELNGSIRNMLLRLS